MADKNDKTAFQLGTDSASKIAHPRRHSAAVNQTIEERRSFKDTFEAKIARAAALSGDEARPLLYRLLEAIRFSDPIGVDATLQDEETLQSIADSFLVSIENGDSISSGAIEKAVRLLAIRNDACKRSK